MIGDQPKSCYAEKPQLLSQTVKELTQLAALSQNFFPEGGRHVMRNSQRIKPAPGNSDVRECDENTQETSNHLTIIASSLITNKNHR